MAAMNVAKRLIGDHLVEGQMEPGEEIALRIDQTLTQDATGTMVMLELEALGLDRVKTEKSAQYVDHNILQTDHKNGDDHLFLQSAARRFGLWYSPPGSGVSHPVHMESFAVPGKTLLGSDSHTPAAGGIGMLAMGAGGLEVAMAMAGEPIWLKMPKIWGVRLEGDLPDWVSAKDIILELLRRHDVDGGIGCILEFHGPGVKQLSAWDRHVIANMGTELGATTTVFPSDDVTKAFLRQQEREHDWVSLVADDDAEYDREETIALDTLEPLIARPSSPGNVVPVADEAGKDIYQAYIGSSANPGLRDFAVPALMLEGRQVHPDVSLDINPTSRQMLENLLQAGYLGTFLASGARIHQTGCNGCIGMGQAPATGGRSLRTVPRNFPGRSGTKEDMVYLVSPETAAASALTGEITDPRTLDMKYPRFKEPAKIIINRNLLQAPPKDGHDIRLTRGPNIKAMPEMPPLPARLDGPVVLKLGDNVSTDEILPAGTRVLPYRSNIPEIAKFTFDAIDESFHDRAIEHQDTGFFIVAGRNYGQGSSREHAVVAPRHLGLRAVVAKSFARIHWQNLINFGALPLTFQDEADHERIHQGDTLTIEGLPGALADGRRLRLENRTQNEDYTLEHTLSPRQRKMVTAGGMINLWRREHGHGHEPQQVA
jgi:aconitate hydratase